MLNYYSSNKIQNMHMKKSSYNQISIEKITNIVNNPKQRAASINKLDKVKQKGKITPSLKAISVNKQIQFKKKNYNRIFILYIENSLLKTI